MEKSVLLEEGPQFRPWDPVSWGAGLTGEELHPESSVRSSVLIYAALIYGGSAAACR